MLCCNLSPSQGARGDSEILRLRRAGGTGVLPGLEGSPCGSGEGAFHRHGVPTARSPPAAGQQHGLVSRSRTAHASCSERTDPRLGYGAVQNAGEDNVGGRCVTCACDGERQAKAGAEHCPCKSLPRSAGSGAELPSHLYSPLRAGPEGCRLSERSFFSTSKRSPNLMK